MNQETLIERTTSQVKDARVDRERGIVFGVKVLGIHSRNGRTYSAQSLLKGARLYEGAAVHVNHTGAHGEHPRDYRDRIGVIRQVQYRDGDGLYADLHFNPRHGVAEQLAWDAEQAAKGIGLSHHIDAVVRRSDGNLEVEDIVRVHSVDLVTDPATTQGLFEACQSPHCENEAALSTVREAALSKARLDALSSEEDSESDSLAAAEASVRWSGITEAMLEATRPDLVSSIRRGVNERAARLERELKELRRSIQAWESSSALACYGLRPPTDADGWCTATGERVDAVFWRELLECKQVDAKKQMIESRLAWASGRESAERCSSREQMWRRGANEVRDSSEFVKLIMAH